MKARARVRLDSDERRAQLVELGLAEFGDKTYDDVSIDHIAAVAGISKGLLYHYFPNKKAFYVACIREAADRLLRQVNAVPVGPPLETMAARIDAYLAYVRARGPAYPHLMRSGTGIDREVGAIIDETRAALLAMLTEGLATVIPDAPKTPLLEVALRGWIGLAEAASIAWVEACVAEPEAAPALGAVRDLLASAFLALLPLR